MSSVSTDSPASGGISGVKLPGSLSWAQTVIAVAALGGATALGITGHISGDALTALYSTVIGGALGYVNGKKAGSA